MKRVTGIGGIFFKCADVQKTKAWYAKHLGLDTDDYGCTFWQPHLDKDERSSQQWSPFKMESTYFGKEDQQFMINYKVEDLDALINQLKDEGVEVVGEIERFEYGNFGWIIDCDGRKVELWQPLNESLFKKS